MRELFSKEFDLKILVISETVRAMCDLHFLRQVRVDMLGRRGNVLEFSYYIYRFISKASTYLTHLTHHTSPSTKRQRIRDLILSEAKIKDIVDEVKTTKEYVYKERGKLKKEGLLVTHQSLSISNGQKELTIVKDDPQLGENENLDL